MTELLQFAVSIERAVRVDGWMRESELQWLAEQASRHLIIVELGSYLGRSTRALADNTLGKVYAVDDWAGVDAEVDGYRRPVSPSQSDLAYGRFLANVRDLVDRGAVVPVRTEHGESFGLEVAPDMVFIDGDHSYKGCRRDIEAWWPRLAEGGMLCGHDLVHAPVRDAVRDVLGKWSAVDGTSIWYAVKEQA